MLTATDIAMMQSTQAALLADRATIRRGTAFGTLVAKGVPIDVVDASSLHDPSIDTYLQAVNIGYLEYRRITLPPSSGVAERDRIYKEPSSFTVTLPAGTPGSATLTVTVAGQATTGLTAASTAAAIQTALQALSTVGVGNVAVSGNTGGPYTVALASSVGAPYVTVGGIAAPKLVYLSSVYNVVVVRLDETQSVILLADCKIQPTPIS